MHRMPTRPLCWPASWWVPFSFIRLSQTGKEGFVSRYLCIACEVFARPLYSIAATTPNVIDIQLMQRSLHDEPSRMRPKLQKKIDFIEDRGYEAVLLGYGLCGSGTMGLQARNIPIVIPRVHDCIAMLLGSPKRYDEEFEKTPGTYWYSQDFAERADETNRFASLGPISDEGLAKQYEAFLTHYGRENADYLMETLGSWQARYERAAFIDMGLLTPDGYKDSLGNEADRRGWTFEMLAGDLLLLKGLLNGDWAHKDLKNYIAIPPGHTLDITYDKHIFRCTPG